MYSGNGVINGVFNPSIAGLGIHIITYTLGLGTTCESSESQEIVVNGVPLISITPVSDVCLSSGLVNLSATPSGGDFTGNGVVDSDIFDPTIAGIGNHTIMYSFTDIEGCSSVESITITVTDDVEVNIGNLNPVCTNSSPITLNTGSPAGGTYSGDGVSNNIFNPSLLGPGTYTITYTYSENGCEGSASTEVVVNQAPTVNLSPFDKLCIYNESFALTGGSPAGGTYSGPGVSNNSFNPAGAGIGLHTITYTFTNANGCSGSATQTISVEECLGMDNISISNSLQIYPNPTSDRLNIQFNTWVNSDFKITLISYTGAVISEKIVRSHIGEFTENLHLGDLRKGVYFIRITTPKEVITQKVILQ
jgi:hypothetical protein